MRIILVLFVLLMNFSFSQTNLVLTWQKTFIDGRGSQLSFNYSTLSLATTFGTSSLNLKNNSILLIENFLNLNNKDYNVSVKKLNSSGELMWENYYGGSGNDFVREILQTSDGGFIFVGSSDSKNLNYIDSIGNRGKSDAWVVKIDSLGKIEWQNCFGGSYEDRCAGIVETKDKSFAIIGTTLSNDGQVKGMNHGIDDIFFLKITTNGKLVSVKCFGGTNIDAATDIQTSKDGGFIIAGVTNSKDGNVIGNHSPSYNSSNDIWILKISTSGVFQWSKCYGSKDEEGGALSNIGELSTNEHFVNCKIKKTLDGGYIIISSSIGNDGDVSGVHRDFRGDISARDVWVVKINDSGILQWQKCFGGGFDEAGMDISLTNDGGFIFVGNAYSKDGDVIGIHNSNKQYRSDIWVVKINNNGVLQWQKCIGESLNDTGTTIFQNNEGSYILCGTIANDGNTNPGSVTAPRVLIAKITDCNYSINTLNAGKDQKICYGELLVLNAIGASSYAWNNKVVNNVPFIPTVSFSLPETQAYIVIGTDANGCQDSDTVFVTVNPNNNLQITKVVDNYYTWNNQTYSKSGVYMNVFKNKYGCDSTVTLNLTINKLGMEELMNSIVKIYPNPLKNQFHVDYDGIINKIELIDIKGSLVFSLIDDKKDFILPSQIVSGFYLILIHTNEGVYRKDVLIEL